MKTRNSHKGQLLRLDRYVQKIRKRTETTDFESKNRENDNKMIEMLRFRIKTDSKLSLSKQEVKEKKELKTKPKK